MTPELLKLIQQAVENGITAASWIVLVLAIVGAALGAGFGSYLKRKFENYATKEDFADLLRQVQATAKATEEAKLPFLKDLASFTESFKATLTADLEAHKASLQLASAKDLASFTERISTELETLKSQLQEDLYYRTQILSPRLEAYKRLWALTYPARPTRTDSLTKEEKRALRDALTRWYYENGDGICLSLEAGRMWRSARNSLEEQADKKIKDEFSSLKTQLKKDIKVYGEREAEIELGT
jgi:hypothetical protein